MPPPLKSWCDLYYNAGEGDNNGKTSLSLSDFNIKKKHEAKINKKKFID